MGGNLLLHETLVYNLRMKYFLKNFKNSIDFYFRQKIKFSRKNYSELNESKEALFISKELIDAEENLIGKYKLQPLKNNSTRINYLQNLYTIDLLDKYLKPNFKENLKVLDIGSKNWFYAKGEYYFFKKHCEKIFLDGIEIDSNRLYSNFFSRGEVAKFYIKNLDNVNYIEGDFLNNKGQYDYITWFLPFVVKEPLLKWGLTLEFFKPEKMLKHAYESLNEGGKIFIINQGEVEHEAQKHLCERVGIKYEAIGEVQSLFWAYEHKMYLLLIQKQT